MRTQGGNPLVADRDDPRVAGLQAALLRARVLDTTVRLSLAVFRARGYTEEWGKEAEACVGESNAERVRAELAELNARLAALDVGHGLAA